MSLEELARSVKQRGGKKDTGPCFDFLSEKDCCLWVEIEERLRLGKIRFEIRELGVWNMFTTVIYAGDSILFLSNDNGVAKFFWCNRVKIKEIVYAEYIRTEAESKGKTDYIPPPRIETIGSEWEVHYHPAGFKLVAKYLHALDIELSDDWAWFCDRFLVPVQQNIKKIRLVDSDDDGVNKPSMSPNLDFRPC